MVMGVDFTEDATKPPARYNEASLLGAMENAGKLVDDEALAEAMKERGLGTPATRAATIEELLAKTYIERQGKELVPLAKAFQLHQFLHAKEMGVFTEPQMTGEWEYKLKQIEHGKMGPREFMKEIKALLEIIVKKGAVKPPSLELAPQVLSPTDGKPLQTDGEKYFSQDTVGTTDRPKLTIYVGMNGHTITPVEVAELIEKRRIGPFADFRSMKSGKNFTGYIDLVDPDTIKPRGTEEKAETAPAPAAEGEEAKPVKAPRKTKPKSPSGKLKAVLYFPPREGADGNPDAFDAEWPILGPCPVSGLAVQHTPTAGYRVCPHKAQEAGAKKTFSLNSEMLKSPISADDVRKLLNEGKTGLKKFVSNRTKRTFEAFLVADKQKGWWFEFPPRKPRAPKGAAVEKKTDEPF
jgi:DNA topoisomerase-3